MLAVDLDPQASLSALFGYQPEIDLSGNDTLYGAIRYDEERRPLSQIIRKTYFDGLDLVPGNLELHEFEHTTPRMLAERQAGGGADDFFFARIQAALASVADDYDVVVIDCPPQLGFLTLSALCASTSVIVTVHPQMLDVASMSQFLYMTADLLSVVREAGGSLNFDFLRYLVTRYEPNDGPQTQIVGFLRSQFGERVLTAPMVKSTAISDAGLTKQTLYEVGRDNFTRSTYDRAMEALTSVNAEVEALVEAAWGRNAAGRGRMSKRKDHLKALFGGSGEGNVPSPAPEPKSMPRAPENEIGSHTGQGGPGAAQFVRRGEGDGAYALIHDPRSGGCPCHPREPGEG